MVVRIVKIVQILNRKYNVRIKRSEPFQTLISCILSQRTKDETTGPAADRLFKVADTPAKMLKLSSRRIANIIYPVGFYNQKAKRIRRVCRILLNKYGGRVPKTRDELMQLPGVGAKTAAIVLAYAFGKPNVAVDTHVNRISKRLGFVKENSKPEKTQEVLERLIPVNRQIIVNHLFVTFGKAICQPRVPKCYICPVEKLCPYPNKNLRQNMYPK
jgi:endonuclease-3